MEDVKSVRTTSVVQKVTVLRLQLAVSAILAVLAITQLLNVVKINGYSSNHITLLLITVDALIIVLSCGAIALAMQIKKRLPFVAHHDQLTNTIYSQAVLFFTLILSVMHIVLLIVFTMAQGDLLNQAHVDQHQHHSLFADTACLQSTNGLSEFQEVLTSHYHWVTTPGIFIAILLFASVFTWDNLTESKQCTHVMIFLFSTLLVVVGCSTFSQISVVRSTLNHHVIPFAQTLNLITIVIIITFIVVTVQVIANSRSKGISYLLTGAAFLLLLAAVLPAVGSLFKSYQHTVNEYDASCSTRLDHISYESLRSAGCEHKYVFKNNSTAECNSNDFSKCFESIENIQQKVKTAADEDSKSFITTVWETSLYANAVTRPRLAGLSKQCCGTVTNVNSRPILNLAALVLTYIALTFILASFAFKSASFLTNDQLIPQQGSAGLHLSSPPPPPANISLATRNRFIVLFITAFLISGVIAIVTAQSPGIVHRDNITVGSRVQRSAPVNMYHEFNYCTSFQYFEEETLVDADYKTFLLKDINVARANSTYCTSCTAPDILIVIQTVRGETDVCPPNFAFEYETAFASKNDVHVIPSSIAQPFASTTVCVDEATKQKKCVPCGNYLGIAGEPKAVIAYIHDEIKACNRKGIKFVIQPFQINASLFTPKISPVTTPADAKLLLKKSLKHSSETVLPPPRLLAATPLIHHELIVSVRDIVTSIGVASAKVILYESYDNEGKCESGSNAKQVDVKQTDSDGDVVLDFLYTILPITRYTVEVHSGSYAVNCRAFTIAENRKYLDVALSPPLKEHQIRFILEWGSDSFSSKTNDLDLYLVSNSVEDKWLCYSSYFSKRCAGAVHHGDSKGDDRSSEGITIDDLAKAKYLIFFKLPVVNINKFGEINNSIIIQLKPLVKVYTFGQSKPTQTTMFDSAIEKGISAGYENNYRFANLAWCVNGLNSEIVKSAKGFSYPVSWLTADPGQADTYDLPLASASCT